MSNLGNDVSAWRLRNSSTNYQRREICFRMQETFNEVWFPIVFQWEVELAGFKIVPHHRMYIFKNNIWYLCFRLKQNALHQTIILRRRGAWRPHPPATQERRQMLPLWVDPRAHHHPITSNIWSRWWDEIIAILWEASLPSTITPTLMSE